MSERTKQIQSTKSSSSNVVKTMALVAILVIGLAGCTGLFLDPPSGSVDGDGVPGVDGSGSGSLSISVGGELGSSTFLPDVDMDVHDYEITGQGPNGATFSGTTASGSLTVEELISGTWAITVNARNSAGVVIGTGSASGEVQEGQTAPVSVTVKPLEGDGTLRLEVTWPSSDVASPSVVGQANPSWGDPVDLTFTVDGAGHATAADLQLPGGYYTISVQVLDGSEVVAGAVDLARIVKDGVTGGIIDFASVKQSGGGATIVIDPEMENPLTVQLSGGQAQIELGQSMTLTASVADTGVTATYEWYLDGALVGTGGSYSVPSDLSANFYRLDVIARSSDGSRSGSASHEFSVVSNADPVLVQATEFTLYWDVPADDPNPAHYNVYYRSHGAAGWNFLDSAAASGTPSYTVSNTMLAYGVYDFAVTSVSSTGVESELHTSLDPDAVPTGGWYLDWRAP